MSFPNAACAQRISALPTTCSGITKTFKDPTIWHKTQILFLGILEVLEVYGSAGTVEHRSYSKYHRVWYVHWPSAHGLLNICHTFSNFSTNEHTHTWLCSHAHASNGRNPLHKICGTSTWSRCSNTSNGEARFLPTRHFEEPNCHEKTNDCFYVHEEKTPAIDNGCRFFLFFSLGHFSLLFATLLNVGAKICHLHCSSIVEAQPCWV